jgi:hypothetical protein
MAKQTIGIGTVSNDGTGDPLRSAFDKTNQNFDEIYSAWSFSSNNATVANNVLYGNTTVNAISNSTIVTLKNASATANLAATGLVVGTTSINTTAVTAAAANVTSNTLTLGTSSVAANGYSRLPNGILYQWGAVSSNTTVGNITFPAAFSTLYSVTTSARPSAYDATFNTQVIAANTTTANVRTANVTAITVNYMAIGI